MEKIISRDALPDDRPVALQKKDYSTAEVAAALAVPTFENERPRKLGATEFNQWYVGSCVPHGVWTTLEYEGIIDASFNPSQLRSYRKRSNYPSPGSIGVDMFDQIRGGQSNDFPTPPKFREEQATAMPYVAGNKLIQDFRYFQYIDKATGRLMVEDIPTDIALGKAVTIFIYATEDEWEREYVEIQDEDLNILEAEVRHCVCIMPKGDFTKNEKQWLAVHDSARFGGRHLRYIDFEFLKRRCYFAAKVYKVEDIPTPPDTEPTGKPIEVCQIGSKGQAVINLQKFLIADGKLEPQYQTGYYGAITAKAVLWWQLEHWDRFTANIPQLLEWGGEYWGPQSISIINQ